MKDIYVVIFSVEAKIRSVKLFSTHESAKEYFTDIYNDIVARSKNKKLNYRYDEFEVHDIATPEHSKDIVREAFGEQYANKEGVWFECPCGGDYAYLEIIKADYDDGIV